MKSFKYILAIIIMSFTFTSVVDAQPKKTTTRPKKLAAPYWTLSPVGGVMFPVGSLGDNFKAGGNVGLDIGYRVNREVGFFAKFGYYFFSSKTDGVPSGKYIEVTAGPRYFFTDPKLSSTLFGEVGGGIYNFRQDEFTPNVGPIIPEISDTKAGVNAGLGANLALSQTIDIIIKPKYHVIFTEGGSTSFITVVAGLEFKLK